MNNLLNAMKEQLSTMIKNPLDTAEWTDMQDIYKDEETTISICFEKFIIDIPILLKASVMCKINITDEYDIEDEDGKDTIIENRVIIFDLYGSEMLPYNNLVACDKVLKVFSCLSEIVGRKYTFHTYGNPHLTLDKKEIRYWK